MFFCLLQNIHRIYSNFYLKNHQNKPLVIYYKLTCKWNGVVSSRAYRGLVITVRVASVPEVWTQGHLLFPGINGMHILIWLLTQCVVSWSDYTMLTFFFFSQQIVEDWKFIAQVLDRLFLWTFLLVSIIGSLGLFVPVIYKWANIIVPINIGNANKWYFPRDWSRNLLTKKHITLWHLYNHENVNCV